MIQSILTFKMRVDSGLAQLGLTQLLCLCLLLVCTPQIVLALLAPSGWIDQSAELVSPQAAQTTIAQRELSLEQQRNQQAKQQAKQAASAGHAALASQATTLQPAASLVSAASEFSQIAADLENDPRRIYQYVRNYFTYAPYYGALKGAYLTL